MTLRYCPSCGGPLADAVLSDITRQACADAACGYVFWNNPVPVVAAIVEYRQRLILARNVAWPAGMFGLITGFLEAGETPEAGVVREVKEELDLDGQVCELVGVYDFQRKNQLILAYHVQASGSITLNEELAEYRELAPEAVRYWPMDTGWAIKDWLEARGYAPERIELPISRASD